MDQNPDEFFLYHISGGRAYRADRGQSLPNERKRLRKAYGDLRGVKFVFARSRHEALSMISGNPIAA
jgi:hypothetical protein